MGSGAFRLCSTSADYLWLGNGELYDKGRALAFPFGFNPNLAAVTFHHLLRYEEAVASRVHVDLDRVFSVPAFSEKPRHVFCGDADAAVFDGEANGCAVLEKYLNRSGGSIADCVVDEIPDDMSADFVFVALKREFAFSD